MTGIGGDMFAILWDANSRRLVGLDASGKSGSNVDVEALLAEEEPSVPGSGPRSVTVPGALSGWNALIEKYGTVTLAGASTAIRIANEGFPVTPIIAQDWAGTVNGLRRDIGAAATFLIDDEAPEAGDWFRNLTSPGLSNGSPMVAHRNSTGETSAVKLLRARHARRLPHPRGPEKPRTQMGRTAIGRL